MKWKGVERPDCKSGTPGLKFTSGLYILLWNLGKILIFGLL